MRIVTDLHSDAQWCQNGRDHRVEYAAYKQICVQKIFLAVSILCFA